MCPLDLIYGPHMFQVAIIVYGQFYNLLFPLSLNIRPQDNALFLHSFVMIILEDSARLCSH